MSKTTVSHKVTILDLQRMKAENRKIAMITAYDYTMARLVDAAGVDVVLVGDSLGMVVQGLENTLAVTMDQMIYHCRCVAAGLSHAHLVLDLPFMSYRSPQHALDVAARALSEGRAESVKLEGGQEVAPIIASLVNWGIPVMAHIGLTPQSIHAMGGFKIQGRDEETAARLRDDAQAVEQAGAYSVVLEGMPLELAEEVTDRLSIPTIGIGAGKGCDGQVLVVNDLLGLDDSFKPRFVKRYASLHSTIKDAVFQYVQEVRSGAFPDEAHSFRAQVRREVA